jgi:hypothetical protein
MNPMQLHNAAAEQADQRVGELWLFHIGWVFCITGIGAFLIPMLFVRLALGENGSHACGPWLLGSSLVEVAVVWVVRRLQRGAWWRVYKEAYAHLEQRDK